MRLDDRVCIDPFEAGAVAGVGDGCCRVYFRESRAWVLVARPFSEVVDVLERGRLARSPRPG